MPTIHMIIGLPGSGKSSVAKNIARNSGAVIFESDAYRKEKYGDEKIQGDNSKLFAEMQNDMIETLKNGTSVVFDATNTRSKYRIPFIEQVNKFALVNAIVISVPLYICFERNLKRSRQVPEEVITRMWKDFQFPTYGEGFDYIEVYPNFDVLDNAFIRIYDPFEKLAFLDKMEQDNPHHSLTVGGHIREVMSAFTPYTLEWWSAMLHDFGKEYTKTFDENGVAHFYGHENISAYNAPLHLMAFGTFSNHPIVTISQTVAYHMRPYQAQSEKAIQKVKKLLGDEIYEKVMVLNGADKEGKQSG